MGQTTDTVGSYKRDKEFQRQKEDSRGMLL